MAIDKKTLVLGLGNPILTDDGVGVLVVEAVKSRLPALAQVDFTEVSVGGLTLMESMIGYNRVILIDAYQPSGSLNPGAVHRFTLEDMQLLSPTQHSASPHDASLITALEAGRRMGLQLPEQVTIFAVEVENVTDFGDRPTELVRAAIPKIVDDVIAELDLR
jgi:hydrogenase maturation protease